MSLSPNVQNFLKHAMYYVIFTLVTVGGIYLWGYMKGKGSNPAKTTLSYVEQVTLKNIPDDTNYLEKAAYSSDIYAVLHNGKRVLLKSGDLSNNKDLRPVAICLEPVFVVGGSFGETKI